MQPVIERTTLGTPQPGHVELWANNASQTFAATIQQIGYRVNRLLPKDGSEDFEGDFTMAGGNFFILLSESGDEGISAIHNGTDAIFNGVATSAFIYQNAAFEVDTDAGNDPFRVARTANDAQRWIAWADATANWLRSESTTSATKNLIIRATTNAAGSGGSIEPGVILRGRGNTDLLLANNNGLFPMAQATGKIEALSGGFGSVQVSGAQGAASWSGYNIGGRLVFMENGGSASANRGGIFDDQNDQWVVQFNVDSSSRHVALYSAGTLEAETQDSDGSDNITGLQVKHFDQTLYPVGIAPIPIVDISTSTTLSDTHQLKMLRWVSGVAGLDVTFDQDTSMRSFGWGMIANRSGASKDLVQGSGVTLRWMDGAGSATGDRVLADGGIVTWWKRSDTEFYVWGPAGLS